MGASQLKIVIEHSGFRTSHFKLIIALLWLYAAEMYVECSFDIVDKNIAEHSTYYSKSYIRTVYHRALLVPSQMFLLPVTCMLMQPHNIINVGFELCANNVLDG